MKVYQVRSHVAEFDEEYDNLEQAKHMAELLDSCELITWRVEPNWGNSLPKVVYKSLALSVWENGKWRECFIHGYPTSEVCT